MPWSAPTPYGTPPAYTGGWQPGAHPHTGAPVLAPRQPTAAYHAAPSYAPSIYNTSPYASYGAPSPPYMQQYNDGVSLFTPMPALLPTPPHPQAPMTTPASTSAPSWDQAAFLQAMNNFAAQGNSGTNWISILVLLVICLHRVICFLLAHIRLFPLLLSVMDLLFLLSVSGRLKSNPQLSLCFFVMFL